MTDTGSRCARLFAVVGGRDRPPVFDNRVVAYAGVILMVPIGFLVRDGLSRGFRHCESPALAATFLLPLLYLLSIVAGWPRSMDGQICWLVGPSMCLILFLVLASRATAEAALAARSHVPPHADSYEA